MPHLEIQNLIKVLLVEHDKMSTEGETLLQKPTVSTPEFAVFFGKVVDLDKKCGYGLDDTGKLKKAHFKLFDIALEIVKNKLT